MSQPELLVAIIVVLNLIITFVVRKTLKRKATSQNIQNFVLWNRQLIFSAVFAVYILGYAVWRVLFTQWLYPSEMVQIIMAGCVLSWGVAYFVIWIQVKFNR